MASSFGTLFRVSTFGESHGGGVGVVIDGCPPRLALEIADIQRMAVVADDVRSSEATATMGKRVRATVPGGHIFGRVQKQHGGLVTIRTDSGATVVVESHRVAALGARRAVLIHR